MTLALLSETITLGVLIIGGIVSIAAIVGVIYGARWKTAAEVEAANAAAWEDTARRLQLEVERISARVDDQGKTIRRLQGRIAELEGLPDVAAVHREVLEHDQKAAEAMRVHDQHADTRAARIVGVMEEIRDELRSGR